MATWIWAILVIVAFWLGFLFAALCQASSRSDDWMDGYRAARRDMERERKKREGGGE
jgi:phosphatidylglycerophosphate synthase